MAQLFPPTTAVRDSYLAGETEAAIQEGLPTDWLQEAAADFASFVERRRTVREQWGVPVTERWFVDSTTYLGAATPPRCWPRPWWSASGSDCARSWSPARWTTWARAG